MSAVCLCVNHVTQIITETFHLALTDPPISSYHQPTFGQSNSLLRLFIIAYSGVKVNFPRFSFPQFVPRALFISWAHVSRVAGSQIIND